MPPPHSAASCRPPISSPALHSWGPGWTPLPLVGDGRRAAPELVATQPNQLCSWDSTNLKGPAAWTYFYLYVIMDVLYVSMDVYSSRQHRSLSPAYGGQPTLWLWRVIQSKLGEVAINKPQTTR